MTSGRWLAWALFGLAVPAAHAQQRAKLSGYFEHQYSTSRTDEGWTQLDYDRLRVDIDARAGRGTRAAGSVVYQIFRGDTETRLRDFLPSQLDSLADTAFVAIEDRHFVNSAYVSINAGRVEITAGKQYLTWGTGFAFNPTELFRPKNVFEPSYDREGIGAIAARITLGSLSDVTAAFVPKGGFESSGKLVRARHHLGGFDLSAIVAELYEPLVRESLAIGGEALERRFTVGGDVTGELFGLGVWAEATWSELGGERWVEATVGGNYTLADGTLLALEGFYNGRGEWSDPYPTDLWLGRFFGERRSLGKGIVYAVLTRPIGQLWNIGLSSLANPGDASAIVIPAVTYAFAENVDLVFNGLLYAGSDGTEFGAGSVGGFLRGRVYF